MPGLPIGKTKGEENAYLPGRRHPTRWRDVPYPRPRDFRGERIRIGARGAAVGAKGVTAMGVPIHEAIGYEPLQRLSLDVAQLRALDALADGRWRERMVTPGRPLPAISCRGAERRTDCGPGRSDRGARF